MAEALQFTTAEEAFKVFPDLASKSVSRGGRLWVHDEKSDEDVEVQRGQYIVSIADRYEVKDEAPQKAHEVTPEDVEPDEEEDEDDE